jgi:hypothetical protein
MIELSKFWTDKIQISKGECQMSMPKTIAAWCTVLFFLLYGIAAFFAFPMSATIVGILALGAAIFTFIGK